MPKCTVKPNKLKHTVVWNRERFVARVMQGNGWLIALNSPEL